jgi:hypothetical protein
MKLNANQKDTLKCREYHISGILNLSGTSTVVGSMQEKNPRDDSVFLQTDENPEPIFMSPMEARMLIANLQSAVAELEKE